jgi:hypothetical protein
MDPTSYELLDLTVEWARSLSQPYVKGFTSMVNSVYNGWCFEDLWLTNSTLERIIQLTNYGYYDNVFPMRVSFLVPTSGGSLGKS